MVAMNQAIPEYIQNKWTEIKEELRIDKKLQLNQITCRVLKQIFANSNAQTLQSQDNTRTLKQILTTGNHHDASLIKAWCNTILDLQIYKYTKEYPLRDLNCLSCQVRGNQEHFINDCRMFSDQREKLLNELRKTGLNIESKDLKNFVINLRRKTS